MKNIPQVHKLSRASQLSLVAVVILFGAVLFTVNSAMQQEKSASNASGSANMLINSSFESGTSPWFLTKDSPGAGTYTTTSSQHEDGSYAAQINVTGTSSNPWYVQLDQEGMPMQSGQPYTVTFWAKASASRPIEALVQQSASPWAVYADVKYTATTSWQQYSYTFTPTTTQSNVVVEFNLAQATGQVWIDNVSYSTGYTSPTAVPTVYYAPTAYPTEAPMPTIAPTAIIAPTTAPMATPFPTAILSPIATPVPGDTLLALNVGLQGIGTAGDNRTNTLNDCTVANPPTACDGTMNPLHPQRIVTVTVLNSQNQQVANPQGTITYDANSGKFIGTIDLGQNFATGLYTVKVTTDQFLTAIVPGIQTITSAQTTNLPYVSLIAGDVDGNNQINILDYNILMGCYSDLFPATNCNPTNNALSDLNDDGAVNQDDLNLFPQRAQQCKWTIKNSFGLKG